MASIRRREVTAEVICRSSKRHQLVIAAAGSGKTQLLVDVLASRIEQGMVAPSQDKVIVFTFTNNAADELVVRLSAALKSKRQQSELNHIYIGTIHAWCNEFLTETGVLSNTKVIDELERAQLVQRVYPLLGLEYLYQGKNQFDRIDKFLKDLELFYNDALDIRDTSIPQNVRTAIENYLEFIKGQRLMDFGFLIREAAVRLSDAGSSSRPFQLYVDEYQDVNPAQVRLLQAMLGSNDRSRLFAVGDPRQCIYQWRGSDVTRILRFEEDFPDSEVFQATINRRSRTGIVSFANAVARDMSFPNQVSIADMDVSSSRRDERISVIIDMVGFPHEDVISKQVERLLKNGIPPENIAILMRSVVNHGQQLMDALANRGIPFYSPNRNAGTEFVRRFMNSVIELVKLAHEAPMPANRDEEKELAEKVDLLISRIKEYCREKDSQKLHAAVSRWHNELTKDPTRPRNERYNLRQQFFEFCNSVGLKVGPSESDLQEGVSAVTQIMKAIEEAYRRRLLHGYNVRSSPYDVFVNNLHWQLNHQLERWTEVGMNAVKGGVFISTVHAAKGLEWPIVMIPFAWNRRFPVRSSGHGTSFPDSLAERYGTTVEDEKRLWYVAITRARDRLYVFSATDGKHSTSPFLYLDTFAANDKNTCVSLGSISDHELSYVESFKRPHYLHIGASDLLLLLECPHHFFLRKVSGIEVPVGEELGAGNVVHRVIRRLIEGEDPSKIDLILNEEVYLPLSEVEREVNTKKSIKKKITALIRSGSLRTVDATEYKFSIQLRNVVVSGVVDATRRVKDSVELIDWKYSVHREFQVRYENQLKLYAYALRTLGMDVRRAVLYDLSGSGGLHKEVEVNVSQNEVDVVMKKALALIEDLARNGTFTTPSLVSCTICDVSLICPDSLVKDYVVKLNDK